MTAIEFNNISKQYRLGLVSTNTLSHDLKRWYAMNIQGKDDPYLKIGEVNDRAHRGESEYVWALKDINFKVEQGDVLGIIGKNGAGKSTLLKILSKVTTPSTGTIKARGRIASLLEVGTGFHPEMTGRENIYMNGAIMGMTKAEINRKFDEIVDFSGVERYIDTPAKRYSSGMTVRLGFAIAAHLDPEILVVDEVLAVGDAEFQKKAIGKMQDVSKGEGRTVLFVSHNMSAVSRLCKTGVMLENGCIQKVGLMNDVIDTYLGDNSQLDAIYQNNLVNNKVHVVRARLFDNRNAFRNTFSNFEDIFLDVDVLCDSNKKNIRCNIGLVDMQGNLLFLQRVMIDNKQNPLVNFVLTMKSNVFIEGKYFVSLSLDIENEILFELVEKALMFEIVDTQVSVEHNMKNSKEGIIKSVWEIVK